MTTLAVKYRPLSFTDVVGQGHIKPVLRAIVASHNPPSSLIFGGVRGSGKTTCARILAAALNCPNSVKGDACGICESCQSVQVSGSLAVLEVDAASNTGIDDIRAIRELCNYAVDGLWRVVLLDEAHSLSKQAFNALLKILEEPPPNTVFILLTTEIEKILGTVRSRSMFFEFRRLAVADIVGRLETIKAEEGYQTEEPLLQEIAQNSSGALRDAIMSLEQCGRIDITTVAAYRDLMGVSHVALPLFRAALAGDFPAGHEILDHYFYGTGDGQTLVADLSGLIRDLLVLKGGGILIGEADDIEARRELQQSLSTAQLIAATRLLWEMSDRTRFPQDVRSQLEIVFALMVDVLTVKKAEPAPITPSTPITSPRVTDAESLRGLMRG